jgi:membrane-bound lytic murein transglycosylase D
MVQVNDQGSSPGDPTQDVWVRLAKGFTLTDSLGHNARVEQQRKWLVANPSFLNGASARAARYIHFVAQRLEERGLPAELALLPIVESGYNPMANSNRDAVGLWQFIPSTGLDFNLRQTRWYDGRRDILASSKAAMDYLTRLYELFDNDWLLALAAYNAGEGRVGRAVKWNRDRGLPTDFWHLRLPEETQDYVPRLLALSLLVRAPKIHGVKLQPVANEAYFKIVKLTRAVNLSTFAVDAGIDESELLRLNPAFLTKQMIDGPTHLLVPRTLTTPLPSVSTQELSPDLTSYAVLQKPRKRPPSQQLRPPIQAPVPQVPNQQVAVPPQRKPIVVYSDSHTPEMTRPRAFIPRRWL